MDKIRNGDVVRVVIEGSAIIADKRADVFWIDDTYVPTTRAHVKSVEIIKPAAPQVGDVLYDEAVYKLPSGSVVRYKNTGQLYSVRGSHIYNLTTNAEGSAYHNTFTVVALPEKI